MLKIQGGILAIRRGLRDALLLHSFLLPRLPPKGLAGQSHPKRESQPMGGRRSARFSTAGEHWIGLVRATARVPTFAASSDALGGREG